MIGRTNYLLLREVADRLLARPDLLCSLHAEFEPHGVLTITVRVPGDLDRELDVIELAQQLDALAAMGNMRAFAEQYGIAPEAIEALIAAHQKEKPTP